MSATNGGKRVVVVFATWSYRHILTNWILVAPRQVRSELVVHAYGMFYPIFLRLFGHRVVWASMRRPTRSKIWLDRVQATLSYLERAVEVVVCDADAIVLRDFTDDLDAVEGDLIVSQGFFPKAAFEAWDGFTLCCGFAVYRPSPRALILMRQVLDYSGAGRYDDQIALNSVLLENNLVWAPPRNQYFIEDSKRVARCFPENLVGIIPRGDLVGLRVVLLPHAVYRRMTNSSEVIEPKVFHPLPRQGKAKGVEQSLRENGLWRL